MIGHETESQDLDTLSSGKRGEKGKIYQAIFDGVKDQESLLRPLVNVVNRFRDDPAFFDAHDMPLLLTGRTIRPIGKNAEMFSMKHHDKRLLLLSSPDISLPMLNNK